MVTLVLSGNALLSKEAGKALAGMLAANSVLTELDVSDNGYDSDEDDAPGFAQELAVGLGANGAVASLDLSQNGIPAEEMGPIERLCESKQIALQK